MLPASPASFLLSVNPQLLTLLEPLIPLSLLCVSHLFFFFIYHRYLSLYSHYFFLVFSFNFFPVLYSSASPTTNTSGCSSSCFSCNSFSRFPSRGVPLEALNSSSQHCIANFRRHKFRGSIRYASPIVSATFWSVFQRRESRKTYNES